MAEDAFVVSPTDHEALKKLLTESAARPPKIETPGVSGIQSADQYVARVPCGETIPAMVGLEPGKNYCCLFKLDWKTGYADPTQELEAMKHPNGDHIRVWVHNIYPDVSVGDSDYIRVIQNKDGRWLNERPFGDSAVPTTTSTTTTGAPSGQVGGSDFVGGASPCDGTCKWTWNLSGNKWDLTTDGCSTAPTTTTATPVTTTTGTPATTTTGVTTTSTTCICPTTSTTTTAAPTSTSTTVAPTTTTGTPTTTTTGVPCTCAPPTFCGTVNGECTITYCTNQNAAHPAACSTTPTPAATTTCDCATTTLNPSGCTVGCDWAWVGINAGWHQTTNGCTDACPCSAPTSTGVFCGTAHTDCFVTPAPPPGPAPAPCLGGCTFWWSDALNWTLTDFGCFGGATNCNCIPPSNDGTECAPVRVGCGVPTTPTPATTTAAPCAHCYTTTSTSTSTTTTTLDPNGCEYCDYKWSGSAWGITADNCGPNCNCGVPAVDGVDTCQVLRMPCIESPTTTTAGPTTTTTPGPCCVYLGDIGGGITGQICTHVTTYAACAALGPIISYSPGALCQPIGADFMCCPEGSGFFQILCCWANGLMCELIEGCGDEADGIELCTARNGTGIDFCTNCTSTSSTSTTTTTAGPTTTTATPVTTTTACVAGSENVRWVCKFSGMDCATGIPMWLLAPGGISCCTPGWSKCIPTTACTCVNQGAEAFAGCAATGASCPTTTPP